MQITNPYDVPVKIYSVNTTLPVELVDPIKNPQKLKFISLLSEVFKKAAVVPEIITASSPALPSQGDHQHSESFDLAIVLQPGNSTVQSFTICTRWAIFFQPASYNLYLWIDYEMEGLRNKDAICYKLNIRAPLKAMIYGSIIGSVMGFILRSINDSLTVVVPTDWISILSWLVKLFGNVLLSAIVVIAFARKKDTQPILSIEDFWGGVFIGFLAGYTGKSILNQFIGSKP